MRLGSLFSGYGGLDMAVEAVTGATTAWVSDIEPGACTLLAHRFPDVPNIGDISKVAWSAVEPVDVLTGGFPCQDISSSGRKAGVRDGAKSGLWAEMARAIGELRPGLVVVENVRDLASRGLDIVVGDLSDLGYDAQWTSLPACAIGAPFARVRLFLAATPTGADGRRFPQLPELHSLPHEAVPIREGWQRRHADRLGMADQRLLGRWAQLLGRPAPDPLEYGTNGQPRLTAAFEEWLMGLSAGWVTDVPGLTHTQQIKLLGNGVVPAQAVAALTHLLTVEAAA